MILALTIEGLSCVRGMRTVFRDLSFALDAGALLTVEGPNGSGKTSLLRLIAGFLQPAAGIIRLNGDGTVFSDGEDRGAYIGWLGHQDAVKAQLALSEQLGFWARMYGAKGDPDAALAAVGLGGAGDLPGRFLSAGQRRRLALARLKLCNRPLWLLDEPLAALDAAGKAMVKDAVAAHVADGGIALVATHEPLGLAATTLTLGRDA